MSKPATIFFTGMESVDAEQLVALFHELNRRSGNRWSLAESLNTAGVLVIDVDTLYGHMTWLGSQHSDQTIVALTRNEKADADFILQRPVTTEAMRRLLHELSDRVEAKPAGAAKQAGGSHAEIAQPAAPEVPEASIAPASRITQPAPAITPVPAPDAAPAVHATPAPTPAPARTEPVPAPKPVAQHLLDVLLGGEIGAGPHKLELPGQPPLVLDLGQKIFLCGSSIKAWLPHTKAKLDGQAWRFVSSNEFARLQEHIGTPQPLGRLLWLAALGASGGEVPGGEAGTRYKLGKWPQIEREFPKHFRIATAMMKGYLTAAEIAAQCGASEAEVNEFIAASLVSGHAETEPVATPDDAAPAAPRSLLDRLRGAR